MYLGIFLMSQFDHERQSPIPGFAVSPWWFVVVVAGFASSIFGIWWAASAQDAFDAKAKEQSNHELKGPEAEAGALRTDLT